MPGCLSYVIAADRADPDAIWVTEVWDTQGSHDASLALPQVRAAIAEARPLIAGFDGGAETDVLGGVGLPSCPLPVIKGPLTLFQRLQRSFDHC
jgi:hypothetical protein